MNFKPLSHRILLKRKEAEEVSPGGIIIPSIALEKPQLATVMAVGPGKRLDNGKIQKPSVKEGDTVLVDKWAGNEIKIEGEDYLICAEDQILGIASETS